MVIPGLKPRPAHWHLSQDKFQRRSSLDYLIELTVLVLTDYISVIMFQTQLNTNSINMSQQIQVCGNLEILCNSLIDSVSTWNIIACTFGMHNQSKATENVSFGLRLCSHETDCIIK